MHKDNASVLTLLLEVVIYNILHIELIKQAE